MKRQIIIISIFLLFLRFSGISQQKITVEQYISQYKELAVKEMKNCRIPASITLAQGILESNNGNSPLAVEANNHFGIKCHKEWTGNTFIYDDDVKNECFRKYNKVEDSYRDHSEFLTTRDRYKSLFELKITDYKGWAHGLKQAGYATNPRYPDLLIRIIEDNGLDELDKVGSQQSAVSSQQSAVVSRQSKIETRNKKPETTTQNSSPPEVFDIAGRGGNDRIIFINNGVKFILARKNDTFYNIADEFGIYSWQVYANNDLRKQDKLTVGQKVYLEKKKKKAKFDYHVVQTGETLSSVAQDYGIRLKSLCRLNGMKAGHAIAEGVKLKLR